MCCTRQLPQAVTGWIHSKKRNRLGQALVERLVRTHTNMILEENMLDWRATVFPWEDDMIIDEPDSESEDD